MVKEGFTIRNILLDSDIPEIHHKYTHVTLNGEVVDPATWWWVRPKAGDMLLIHVLPAGGGGGKKNPLKMILSIAVMAASFYLGPGLGAAIGEGLGVTVTATNAATWTAVGSAAITIVGNLIVNALIPPPIPDLGGTSSSPESPTLSLTGVQNRANKFGVIPRVYGRHRAFPLFAAQPYTEADGDITTLYALFDFGYGPLELSDLKIGETPVSEFTGVDIDILEEHTTGEIALYRNSVSTVGYSVLIPKATPVVRTTAVNTDEASIDINFPGLIAYEDGGPNTTSVDLKFEYAVAGSGSYSVATGDLAAVSGDVTKTSPVDGAREIIWTTDDVVTQNPMTLSLSVPTSYAASALYGMKYEVYTAPDGSSTWVKQFESDRDLVDGSVSDGWTTPGNSLTLSLAATLGKRMKVRVVQKNLGITSGSWDGTNDSGNGYEAIPVASLNYLTEDLTYGAGVIRFTEKISSNYTRSLRLKFPSKGEWDVRVTRLTDDAIVDRKVDEAFLAAIKSVSYESPVSFEVPHTLVAMRIQASDQLNGVVDTFNAVAYSKLPVWDGSNWSVQKTRNPAWIYADILRGSACKKPLTDDQIDLPGLLEWANACDVAAPQADYPSGVTVTNDEPYWTCDLVVDWDTTQFDLLRQVSSVGRAAIARINGRPGVVRDVAQSTPVQVFTPRNSSGFSGEKQFFERPDALRVRYVEPAQDWEQEEVIVYADGKDDSNSTIYDELDMFGCTRRDQAWREGRYHLAVGSLRQEVFTLTTDVEHIVCTRGDLVEVAHDVPMLGGTSARVVSVSKVGSDVTSFQTDELVSLESGVNYVARVRKANGTVHSIDLNESGQETNEFTLVSPDTEANTLSVGELIVVGQTDMVVEQCIVKEIVPQADLMAQITLIPAAPGVHTADTGVIPAYDPQLVEKADIATPPAVIGVDGTFALTLTDDQVRAGLAYEYFVAIQWRMPTGFFAAAYEVYRQRPDGVNWEHIGSTTNKEFIDSDLVRGDQYCYRVRAINSEGKGIPLDQCTSGCVTVIGLVPDAPTVFTGDVVDGQIKLSWVKPDTTNLSYYQIRFSTDTAATADWDTAQILVDSISAAETTALTYAYTGTYMMKSFDADGYESTDPVLVETNVPALEGYATVVSIVEDPTFSGVKTRCSVTSSELRLDTGETDGLYEFNSSVDLGSKYTVKVNTAMIYTAFNVSTLFDDAPGNFDDTSGLFDSGGVSSTATAYIEAQFDSSGTWQRVQSGLYTFQTALFRVQLATTDANITPSISALAVEIDMPDRTEGDTNVTSPVNGVSITYSDEFIENPAVVITGESLSTGDYHVVSSKSTAGFTIEFFDSTDTSVSRTFDWIAKGGGRKVT